MFSCFEIEPCLEMDYIRYQLQRHPREQIIKKAEVE